jgi:hypothetical protein
VLVARLPQLLSGLYHALSQERDARASVALALEQLQSGDLPLHGAVAPIQGLNLAKGEKTAM